LQKNIIGEIAGLKTGLRSVNISPVRDDSEVDEGIARERGAEPIEFANRTVVTTILQLGLNPGWCPPETLCCVRPPTSVRARQGYGGRAPMARHLRHGRDSQTERGLNNEVAQE
jgi:hypothetical protein